MDELPTELNIITLNCWGLQHIVALQECWTQNDYRSIRRETRFALPFGKYYHSGILGSGLAILSKWPIEESSMFRYSLNGRPTAFFRGDWLVGKGVACARIRYGAGEKDIVEVFNTHTHSIYEHPPKTDSYEVHRLSQAWEIAKLVRGATERGHLVVALGDFNDVPLSLSYRLISAHAPVRDAWRVLHPDSSLGSAEHELERARRRPVPTAAVNITDNGVTSNSVYNTWAWPKSEQMKLRSGQNPMLVSPDAPDARGQRLDYIFFSRGSPPTSRSHFPEEDDGEGHPEGSNRIPDPGWVVKDVRVGMMSRHPQLGCSLSDHFSVEATLILHHPGADFLKTPSRSLRSRPSTDDAATGILTMEGRVEAMEQGTYLQSPTTSEFRNSRDRALYDAQLWASSAVGGPNDGLPCSAYDDILALVHAYAAREASQKRWRACHFLVWVAVAVACYVAVWFAPTPAAFAFLLVSTLGLAVGTVDGLMSVLFFPSEMRALKEFEWEMMNAKATASGAHGLVQDDEKTW